MDRDTIIRLAREAGWSGSYTQWREPDGSPDWTPVKESLTVPVTMEQIERFAALVAAHEQQFTNNAYRERNQLVALLSTLFPSGKAKTAIEGWDEAWHGCVYIDFPWGQASWHYHTDDEWMFAHLPPYTKPWDGHTTEAKYAAIAAAIRSKS